MNIYSCYVTIISVTVANSTDSKKSNDGEGFELTNPRLTFLRA